MSYTFPLIYCNGDSYSDENYKDFSKDNIYANFVGKYCNGFVLNRAISGSCNRRIIRSTVHDMILQRQLNPTQQIIALINLSFELKTELWADEIPPHSPEESHFKSHQFSGQLTWREDLLKGISIRTQNTYNLDKKFFDFYSKGRAFFYSPYAERINLLTDLVMFRSLMDSLNVNFLVFQGPKADKLQSDYLLDFFKQQLTGDDRFFDFEEFGFCDWCYENNFTPMDSIKRPYIGHYGPDAHQAFAEQVLIPKLKSLKFL